MDAGVLTIPLPRLALAFLPALATLVLLARWSLDVRDASLAVARMLVQLLAIGFVLASIFEAERPAIVVCVLAVMLLAAGLIALRPLREKSPASFVMALTAIATGGVTTLVLVTAGVLQLSPWFLPRYLIPLAGMIFANSMNTVSLAAERFEAEDVAGRSYLEARDAALRVAMIPTVNSLLAVGLVSLPGMMTGQILSGVSPLIAARYQIMVMCMVFGASGVTTALYLSWLRPAVRAADA